MFFWLILVINLKTLFSHVMDLSASNFNQVNNYEFVMVEFYATWCGYCKQFAPEYKFVEQHFIDNPDVLIAKIDADNDKNTSLIQSFALQGYPTLKFRHKKLSDHHEDASKLVVVSWIDYEGIKSGVDIIEHINLVLRGEWKPDLDPVIELTDENFNSMISNYKTLVVEFFAPWCGHCKKLAPHYKEAAKILLHSIPEDTKDTEYIRLAKMDATVNKVTAERYNITGYPTLKIFMAGHNEPFDYKGPREDGQNIANYLLSTMGDASKEFDSIRRMKDLLDPEYLSFIGVFENSQDETFIQYTIASNKLRDQFTFLHTFNPDTKQMLKAPCSNCIWAVHPEKYQSKYEPARYMFPQDESITAEALNEFARKWSRPLVGHMTRHNRQNTYLTLPLCIVFYAIDWSFDHRVATQYWRKKVLEVAKDFPNITFAIADESEFSDELKKLGLEDTGEEIAAGCYTQSKRYGMRPDDDFDVSNYRKFIADFNEGKLTPIIWSAPLPTPAQQAKTAVKILVALNYEQTVKSALNEGKVVLIEFYAPWCGHCKQLEPIYNDLAKAFIDNERVLIAKFDATANDFDRSIAEVKGFPTLILFKPPLYTKENSVIFKGRRDLITMQKFIESHLLPDAEQPDKDEL